MTPERVFFMLVAQASIFQAEQDSKWVAAQSRAINELVRGRWEELEKKESVRRLLLGNYRPGKLIVPGR